MGKLFRNIAQIAAVFLLIVGCFIVLQPFLAAALLAAVACVSTWPLYQWLLRKMKERKNIASLTMTASLALVVILPLTFVTYNLSDNVAAFYKGIDQAIEAGPHEPPAWVQSLPIIGESTNQYWHLVATNHDELAALEDHLLKPAKDFLLAGGILLGQGVIQMCLAAFICFFFYRDGIDLTHFLNVAMAKVAGDHAKNILDIVTNTIRTVMYVLLGNALAQGVVATIGFAIAGVPGAFLLGAATALFSLTPIGPPIIWGSVAIWLFYEGAMGWGLFMVSWGFFLISGVDNLLLPFMISRDSHLPFILILFGVMGGLFSFGFIGIFIGPTLIAVGYSLIKEWISHNSKT